MFTNRYLLGALWVFLTIRRYGSEKPVDSISASTTTKLALLWRLKLLQKRRQDFGCMQPRPVCNISTYPRSGCRGVRRAGSRRRTNSFEKESGELLCLSQCRRQRWLEFKKVLHYGQAAADA